mmetsp:Transcript_100008/g.308630  ORF Transcript_100008/g.308630 Transcript_100008/m.308630 type:complete len:240 (+) Transcript_100008:725-1444(+)
MLPRGLAAPHQLLGGVDLLGGELLLPLAQDSQGGLGGRQLLAQLAELPLELLAPGTSRVDPRCHLEALGPHCLQLGRGRTGTPCDGLLQPFCLAGGERCNAPKRLSTLLGLSAEGAHRGGGAGEGRLLLRRPRGSCAAAPQALDLGAEGPQLTEVHVILLEHGEQPAPALVALAAGGRRRGSARRLSDRKHGGAAELAEGHAALRGAARHVLAGVELLGGLCRRRQPSDLDTPFCRTLH